MATLSPTTSSLRATVIGDMIGSRSVPDRRELHRRLQTALSETNERSAPATRLAITVGDEFQGSYARLGDALHATFRILLALAPDFAVRFGVGWGEVTALGQEGADGGSSHDIEDGPGWWSAREAIVRVHDVQTRSANRTVRTEFQAAADTLPPETISLVRAALLLRDHALSSLDPVSLRILHGRMDGRTQTDVADELDITPSAVSQRVLRDGLNLVLKAEDELRSVA